MAIQQFADLPVAFAFIALEQNMRAPDHRRFVPPFIHDGQQLITFFASQFHDIFFVHPLSLPYPEFSPSWRTRITVQFTSHATSDGTNDAINVRSLVAEAIRRWARRTDRIWICISADRVWKTSGPSQ